MANKDEYRPISRFATLFAVEYKKYMKEHKIRQYQLAEYLGRTQPYVNDRITGKRALDTDDIDALAALTGTTGKALLLDLTSKVKEVQRGEMSNEEREAIVNAKIDRLDLTLAAMTDNNKRAEAETFIE